MSIPKLICFDLGGVLVRLDPLSAQRTFLSLAPQHSETLERLLRDDFVHDQEHFSENESFQLGHLSTTEYFSRVRSIIGEQHTDGQLKAALLTVIVGDEPETVRLLEPLSKIARLACFSNTHPLHWNYMLESFAWMSSFEIQMASHLCRIAKPAPGAFRAICEQAQLRSEECLFIDDRLVNVEGARNIGMRAIQFQGPRALIASLEAEGIFL